MDKPRAYLDTDNIIALFKKEVRSADIRRMFYRLKKHNNFTIVISQSVLGEILAVLLKDDETNNNSTFMKFYEFFSEHNIDVKSCLPGISDDICKMMLELRGLDNPLDQNDALIFAYALADPDSEIFLTGDSRIVGNPILIDHIDKLDKEGRRNVKLKIIDTI